MSCGDIGGKYCITSRTGPGFDIGSGFDVHPTGHEGGCDVVGSPRDGIGFSRRVRSQAVIDVDRGDVEMSGAGQSKQGEGIGTARDCARDRCSRGREVAARDEVGDERMVETVEKTSRDGDGSALVVPAALAPARVAVRGDLLQVPTAESGHSEDADHRQHDSDPPVPHIRRKHEASVAV